MAQQPHNLNMMKLMMVFVLVVIASALSFLYVGVQEDPRWIPLLASHVQFLDQDLFEERYMVPVHPYGPNNQVVGIRNSILIAKILNRTLVVADIHEHYMEQDGAPTSFFDLFEIIPQHDMPNIISMKEFANRFHDSVLRGPAIAHKSSYWKFQNRLTELSAHNISIEFSTKAELRPVQFQFDKLVAILHEKAAFDDRFLFFALFNPLRWPGKDVSESLEYAKYFTSIRLKASLIRQAQDLLSGRASDCFVCVHLRPKNDHQSCFDEWGTDEFTNPKSCARQLKTLSWYRDHVNLALDKCPHGRNSTLFAAYFPKMNQTVLSNFLGDYNSLRMSDLLAGSDQFIPHSLSFTEQTICTISTYFVWNHISTWDFNVHFDRLSRSKTLGMDFKEMWNTTIQ